MVFREVIHQFESESPVSVMFRGLLENVFAAERLDRVFEDTAQTQYCRTLLFSTCCDVMAQVVSGTRKSVNAACRKRADIPVSITSVYNKLNGIEPAVSEQLVGQTAKDLVAVVCELRAEVDSPIPGYETRILDGNHLPGSEHRIEELRRLGAAALPGQAIVVYDPQRQLIQDVVLEKDGHANERTLFSRVLALVQSGECWIGDRNFCTLCLLFGILACRGYFVIRQHGQLKGKLLGARTKVGRSDTGRIYEQRLRITDTDGRELEVRRITIKRDRPTQQGEWEIHILTNLPAQVSAVCVAQAYRKRWKIETAFQELATQLHSEIRTLGYPSAALFGFSVGVVLYNALCVIRSALRVVQPQPQSSGSGRAVSLYAVADEISGVWRGMAIVLPAEYWTQRYSSLSPKQLAKKLLSLAKRVDQSCFTTYPWKPKRKQPKRISGNRGNHVSTHKILLQRRT